MNVHVWRWVGGNKVRDIKREIYNYKDSPIKNVACDISQVAYEDSDLNTKLRIPGVINRKISIQNKQNQKKHLLIALQLKPMI